MAWVGFMDEPTPSLLPRITSSALRTLLHRSLVFLPFPYETGVGELCVPAFDLTLQSALVH